MKNIQSKQLAELLLVLSPCYLYDFKVTQSTIEFMCVTACKLSPEMFALDSFMTTLVSKEQTTGEYRSWFAIQF